MDTFELDGHKLYGYAIKITNGTLLVIRAEKGVLGCGYLNVDVADKLNDVLAIVSGVKNYDDMLNATVKAVSQAAAALGITAGMSGRDALRKML